MRKALVLALLLAACRPAERRHAWDKSQIDTAPTDGGVFVTASIGDASFLNPVLASDSASSDINSLVYNGLVKYDKDLKLVGDLAASWEVANAGKTITFHLRPNVRWHDGKPFTSADALYTYQMLVDSNTRTPYSSDYMLVKEALAPDPLTFKVIYREPFAPALESWGMGILPKHIFAGSDINAHPANRHPIGTGPYIFKEWKTDEKIVLAANPDYFEGRPHIDRYVYRIIPDLSVQFLELRQGSLSTMGVTPDQYNGYSEFFLDYDKYHYPAFRYDYFAFNLTNPLFQDRRVREAIAHAINKRDIIDGVYQGLAVPATGPFPPTSWANNPHVEEYAFDLEAAKRLLEEAGWKDSDGDGILDKNGRPFKFTVITNQGNKIRESIAQVVQNGLSKIGIQMDIRIIEWSVFVTKFIDEKQFEATILGWSLSRDPDAYTIWHSSQKKKGQYNFVSYDSPEVDRLLVEGRQTFGEAKRKIIYQKIHALIAHDLPYVFLVVPESLPVVHKKIFGVEQTPAGIGWNFKDWYIPRSWQDKTALHD